MQATGGANGGPPQPTSTTTTTATTATTGPQPPQSTATTGSKPPQPGQKRNWLEVFNVKDVVFLAVLSVVLTLAGMLTMPIVMALPVFGLRNAAAAILYGLFLSIGLFKVRKPGALILLAFFNGAVLLMMTPIMFFNNLVASLISEAITLALFRSYNGDKSAVFAASLFAPLTLPFSVLFTMLFHGQTFAQTVGDNLLLSAGLCVATVVLSVAGALAGLKIARELKKAGVLK
ncbi:MAG: MptD family putative ECF transporter S component [Coriobacteriales bacterium]|nr:MptD family putative ECF transporter S component [Coriobacteriales bacterium]